MRSRVSKLLRVLRMCFLVGVFSGRVICGVRRSMKLSLCSSKWKDMWTNGAKTTERTPNFKWSELTCARWESLTIVSNLRSHHCCLTIRVRNHVVRFDMQTWRVKSTKRWRPPSHHRAPLYRVVPIELGDSWWYTTHTR